MTAADAVALCSKFRGYQKRLRKEGREHDARVVQHCIEITLREAESSKNALVAQLVALAAK